MENSFFELMRRWLVKNGAQERNLQIQRTRADGTHTFRLISCCFIHFEITKQIQNQYNDDNVNSNTELTIQDINGISP